LAAPPFQFLVGVNNQIDHGEPRGHGGCARFICFDGEAVTVRA
jgi:hypothetical protein